MYFIIGFMRKWMELSIKATSGDGRLLVRLFIVIYDLKDKIKVTIFLRITYINNSGKPRN